MKDWLIPDWPVPSKVRACVTTRAGNASQGAYAGFNLALHVGDDPHSVKANRDRLQQRLTCRPAWLEQVHGIDVVEADPSQSLRADAAYSDQPHIACTVMTADCLPVLLCAADGRRVAAAHAGWRGLARGILERTLDCLGDPTQVFVWLGPAISAAAFEVGEDVRQAFVACDKAAEIAFVRIGESRYRADLYALAAMRLRAAGVKWIGGGEYCTWTQSDRFYSYRREPVTGRFASLIWLAE